MKKQIFFILTLLADNILFNTAWAENAIATGSPSVLPQTNTVRQAQIQEEQKYVPPNTQLVQDLCPPVETLVKDPIQQTWSAPNGWKTNAPSFLKTVDSFAGAQWVGVGVGEIICVYTKTGRNTFPVTLQRGKLVPAPVGGLWSENKGGYMECIANDIQQCSFFTQIPKKQENVYDQLDFYKGKPVESGDE